MRISSKKSTSDSYLEHVRALPLRRLRSAADHSRAKKAYLRLSSERIDSGTRDYLDVLADLIVDYEKRANLAMDASELSPADLVRHRLEERGMSVSAMAREIGVPQSNLSEMLSGKRGWSKTAIREISERFDIRAERLLK